MATYVNNLRLKEITTGDEDGTWGTSTNTNLSLIADGFSYGTKAFSADADQTFTMPDFSADATRGLYLKFTGTLTATRTATLGPNTVSKIWIIENATTGSQSITIAQGSGGTVTIPNGQVKAVYTDGAGAGAAVADALVDLALNTPVLTSPTMTAPVLGTPASGTLTNAIGLPISTGVSGLGTGVATFLGTPSSANLAAAVTGETGSGALVFASSPTLTTPNLGTPSAATLTNATGLPLSTGVTGQLPLANGGTAASLSDPNDDRILFWDDSAGAVTWLDIGSGLSLTGTTLSTTDAGGTVTSVSGTGTVNGLTMSGTVTTSGSLTLGGTLAISNADWSGADLSLANGGTGASLSDPNADRIFFWDDSAGTAAWLTVGSGLQISGTSLENTQSGGSVTSVAGTGTVNGLTLTGTVTTAGSLTLGGTLAINNSDWSGADLALANGGTGASLADPNADRILFWDDSAGAVTWLTAGSGLTISGTTITATSSGGTVTSVSGAGSVNGLTLTGTVTSSGDITLGGTLAINNADWSGTDLSLANGGTGASLTAPTADRIMFWDNSAGSMAFLTVGTTMAITGTTFDVSSVNLASQVTGTLPVNNGGTGVTTSTGTGSVVLSSSPTLTTPNLGTPSTATLTNATGLPISTGVSGLGTGVATFLGTPSSANLRAALTDETGTGSAVFATSPTLTTPNLGTPSAATLTNATGLPISTGVSGLGTGVATFLATPSSANLAAAVTGETGSGALVFGTAPSLADPTFSAGYVETIYALSGTALDPSNGTIQTKTLSGNTTFTDSVDAGQSMILMLGAGASYTVTWPTITWVTSAGNVAPTLTANDTFVFWKISTTLYGAYAGSYA